MAPNTRSRTQVEQHDDEGTSTPQGAPPTPPKSDLDEIREMFRILNTKVDAISTRVGTLEAKQERPRVERPPNHVHLDEEDGEEERYEPPPPETPMRPLRRNVPPPEPQREQRVEREPRQPRNEVEDGKLKHHIPEFHGNANPEEFLDWMDQVDLIFQLHNYSANYQVKLVVASFRGHAMTWWKDLGRRRARSGEMPIVTWEHLRNVMKASYVPKSHTTLLRKSLQNLMQGTLSVTEYYHELKRLLLRLEIDENDEETEVRFVEGLNMTLKHKVELEAFRATSLEELFIYALTIEQQLSEEVVARGKSKLVHTSGTRFDPPVAAQPRTLVPTRQHPTASRPGVPVPQNTAQTATSSAQPRVRTRDIRCFKCQGLGHYARECPNQRMMLLGQDGLWYSDEEEENVPETFLGFSDDEKEDPKEAAPKHSLVMMKAMKGDCESVEIDNQRESPFHMPCVIKGKTCLAMVDGGSCANVVSRSLVEELHLATQKHPHPYKLRWLGNYGEVKVYSQCLVPLNVGSYVDSILCDVVPMDACHVLLGRPWEFDCCAIKDCRTNEYIVRNGGRNLRLRPLLPHIARKVHIKLLEESEASRRPKVIERKISEIMGEGSTKNDEKSLVGEGEKCKELATTKELSSQANMHASSSALSFDLLGTHVGDHAMEESHDRCKIHGVKMKKKSGALDSMKNPFQGGGDDVDSNLIMLENMPNKGVETLCRNLTKKRRRRRRPGGKHKHPHGLL